MATTKAKTTSKSSTKKPSKSIKSAASKPARTTRVETITSKAKPSPVKEFFARKYDASENILTIFKSPKIIGAILGEVIGTMLLTMVLLTLGIFNPLYLIFGVMVITIAVFALSGANLNPTITVGLMASRRMSPIRGTLYIIAQLLGAWFGLLVVNGFKLAGGELAQELPVLNTPLWGEGEMFWAITMIELLGAIVIGFCFARALVYKRSVFTFGAVVSGGVFLAVLLAVVLTGNYLAVQDTAFVLNPAVAIMYQALPSEAASFGELLGHIGIALSTYVIFPVLGGAIGFYISDLAAKLSGQKLSE
ncbi:aquaporin [Candidatus Saccharibacteria bacterium]|nr:aquaporin [Candidatus Saccharibacteria bacterium]